MAYTPCFNSNTGPCNDHRIFLLNLMCFLVNLVLEKYAGENQEKILPTFKDWFLILDYSTKTEYKPSEIKNYNTCYNWVDEYVKVKNK